MNPFNLFIADTDRAEFIANHPGVERQELGPGIHGLSNGPFGQPWAKTKDLCGALDLWLSGNAPPGNTQDFGPLFTALQRETPGPGADEHPLLHQSRPEAHQIPVFIRNPVYGTRCCTVLAIGHDGYGTIIERRFDAQGRETGETALDFGPAKAD